MISELKNQTMIVFVALLGVFIFTQAKDPFEKANAFYGNSEWENANEAYTNVFRAIYNGKIDKNEISKDALICGHVNYADVLWALGVDEWQDGNHETAHKKWLQACDHWTYRLEARQFGRKPLDDEWEGSDPSGKTIVVLSERDNGAFGDTFIMSFLMRYLKKEGTNIVFVPQKPIRKLYEADNTLQSGYVDRVAVRGDKLPKHDAKIYLWSLLKNYISDNKRPFPISPWLSGPGLTDEITKLMQQHTGKLLVGFWYRGSGNTSQAADYRSLDRDPGADRMFTALRNIPGVSIICLEGLGHRPVNEKEYALLELEKKLGNLDTIDKTSHDTSSVVILPNSFDKKRGAFVDTLSLMQHIKGKGGVLVGCDTGLLMMAAGTKNERKGEEPSVFAVLNEKADFRWGNNKKQTQKDGSVEARPWYLSSDVEIFQAPKQGQWEVPLGQVRKKVQERALKYNKMLS